MICPSCGASTNSHGIWLGNNTIQCTACGVCFITTTSEVLYRGSSLKMGSHLREQIREKKDAKSK